MVPARKDSRAGMSFVITGYPVVIVENKDPGDSHALEHHAPPCSYAGTGKKLELVGIPSNRIGGRRFRGGSGRRHARRFRG